MKLVFATNNSHKLAEIKALLAPKFEILSLADIHFYQDIPETGSSLEENADIKSRTIHDRFGIDCFSDDTGLEVEALNGAPGVYSARYAGENCSFEDNINKLLLSLENEDNRNARFRTVISLILNGETHHFEGLVEGEILREQSGQEGFGYDPVFKPKSANKSFAEMDFDEKNRISHRGLAIAKLVRFLETI